MNSRVFTHIALLIMGYGMSLLLDVSFQSKEGNCNRIVVHVHSGIDGRSEGT